MVLCVEFIFKMAKRRADVALSKKVEVLKNYLALPKYSQRAAAERLNISIDKRQFLHHQQPVRQLTLDVLAQK